MSRDHRFCELGIRARQINWSVVGWGGASCRLGGWEKEVREEGRKVYTPEGACAWKIREIRSSGEQGENQQVRPGHVGLIGPFTEHRVLSWA